MKQGNFEYALRDIRVGIEIGISCILLHKIGSEFEDKSLKQRIETCESHGIFDCYYTKQLLSAKNHCNDTMHGNCDKDYNQVHFCYKTLEEIIDTLQIMTGLFEPTYDD